ncbi:MAG TPA: OmpA family protein [Bacteroidia bacterium]|nr:OmpA family protein [Bacteroidia bacterium]
MLFIDKIKKILFIPLLLSISVLSYAQDNGSSSCQEMDDKKAVDLYKKGLDMKKYKKEERMAFLKQAMDLEADYVDANFTYGEELIKTANLNQTPFDPAVPFFMKVIQQCPKYHSDPYYFIGASYYDAEKYEDAITYLQKFLSFKDDDEKKFSKKYDDYLFDAKQMVKYAKFYTEIFKHPVPFDPIPVAGLCTKYNEYLATISPDNQYAFFTRKMPYSKMDLTYQAEETQKEFFMESERQKDGSFTAGTPLEPPFNRGQNEGGPAITIDNKHLYFTICKDEGGVQANCDLYYSDFEKGGWNEIKNIGHQVNDPNAWDSQPSIAADGLTLYFASDRAGGMGKIDIWITKKDPKNGIWGSPVNAGAPINTPGNEKTPFIHTDSHTLYFSSDGHMGVGGYDIFYSRADSSGRWTEPVNIGYPINSPGDDLGLFVSTDGKTGYFCSNDPNRANGKGMGGWDIYQFILYSAARPEAVSMISGKNVTSEGDVAEGVDVKIIDAKTKKSVAVMNDTITGEFRAVVNMAQKHDYIVTATKKGAVFNSSVVTIKDTFTGKPVNMDFQVKEINVGSNYTLHNIYYKSNSAQLESVSLAVIEEFAKFLKDNPTVKIKIAGYTDNIGNEQDNLALSKDRAFTVMQALQQEGITPGRLSFVGYGAANPVASNDTEAGRQQNRRTEFTITEK